VDNPERAGALHHLRVLLDTWQTQTGDSIPAVEEMTVNRHDPVTFERLFEAGRPPDGIMPGQIAGAVNINNPGPR
jgi:hypothetical protein